MKPGKRALFKILSILLAVTAAPCSYTALVTPDLLIDTSKSSVTAGFTQTNVPVEGSFRKFSGSVAYDPKQPDASKAHLEVEVGSFDTGSDSYNAEMRKKAWFDSEEFPTAIFEASGVRPLGQNRLQVSGALNLKGKTGNLSFPVALSADSKGTTFAGSVPISRSKFDIGGAQDSISDEIELKFRIVVPATH